MDDDILQVIEEERANNHSIEEMKVALTQRGFQDKDVQEALHKVGHTLNGGESSRKRNIRLFTAKEVLDRIGYGFAPNQFVNILFYQTAMGAGLGHLALFLVGLFNGLKSVISVRISALLQEYSKVKQISKKTIGYGGILFGFSFLFMAFARSIHSVWLFAGALLIGSVGVVSYGDLYNQLLKSSLKKERMGAFLSRISQFGVLLTAACILASGWLMETIPATGKMIGLAGFSFSAYGYLIAFEVTAFAFIISGYVLSRVRQQASDLKYRFSTFLKERRGRVRGQVKRFFSNKYTVLLLIASVLSGAVQSLGNSFYGIFIYNRFENALLGGFLNVAVIYAIAVLVSFLGPWVTRRLNRSIGYSPMLVFGTLLIAMMPAVAAWNPNFYALGAANALSIVGAAIVGAAQGLLARKLLKEDERKLYFASLSFMVTIPFIILLPLGAWLAQVEGLAFLFRILTYVMVAGVVPLYLILVAMANKRRL